MVYFHHFDASNDCFSCIHLLAPRKWLCIREPFRWLKICAKNKYVGGDCSTYIETQSIIKRTSSTSDVTDKSSKKMLNCVLQILEFLRAQYWIGNNWCNVYLMYFASAIIQFDIDLKRYQGQKFQEFVCYATCAYYPKLNYIAANWSMVTSIDYWKINKAFGNLQWQGLGY